MLVLILLLFTYMHLIVLHIVYIYFKILLHRIYIESISYYDSVLIYYNKSNLDLHNNDIISSIIKTLEKATTILPHTTTMLCYTL